jgi:hypothetical protein
MRWTNQGLAAMGFPDPSIEYRLPNLSNLFSDNLANVSLDRVGGQFRGPTKYPDYGVWMNFVRLTDAAIREYEQARGHLEEYRLHANDGRVMGYYRAVNGLENAVGATHRATLNAKRLQSRQSRRLHQPTPRQENLLRLARNRIEHMDEELATKGRVKQGLAHYLLPWTTRLVIGDVTLPYRDLASCITKMYRNVEKIRQAPSK